MYVLDISCRGMSREDVGDCLSWVCRIACESRLRLLEREPSLDAVLSLSAALQLQEFTYNLMLAPKV